MTKILFASKLGPLLYNFIDYKHSIGIPYKNGEYYLADFDRYCSANYPESDLLSKNMCLNWAVIRPTETASGFVSRITPLRQFGKHLVKLGKEAFVLPDRISCHTERPLPHIFSLEELSRFFAVTDDMDRYYQSVVRHFVAPVMFRYLYCCGLRPQEARHIRIGDVDHNTGRVFICESKGHRERLVFLPPALTSLTRNYLNKVKMIFPDTKFLFPDRKGSQLSYDAQSYLFEICLKGSRIIASVRPTLYSFRHSYATHRLYNWMKENRDISAWLPYLSAYMGHSNYASTAYYIHLIPGMFQDMSGMDLSQFEEIIPDVVPE